MDVRLNPQTAVRAIRSYNSGSYRGRTNLDVDQAAYDRFRGGLPTDETALIDAICFVGEEYGGAQRRFLPHGFREEATLIAAKLRPILDDWQLFVNGARSLVEETPEEITLTFLFQPFVGTKRWPVWATKTLHFLRPDVFPIMDSRAKKALAMPSLGSTPRDYRRFCIEVVRQTLLNNEGAVEAARSVDGATSPSDIKLLDKILYELGA